MDGETENTYSNPDFIPIFIPEFSDEEIKEKALKLCKNDTSCLYDVQATGSLEFAQATLDTQEQNVEQVETLSEYISI